MNAELLVDRRVELSEGAFVELVLWRLPAPVPGSRHSYKYRLAYVVNGVCVLRYDNETGKGDHRHFRIAEAAYAFSRAEELLEDFWNDVQRWTDENRGT